MSKWQQFKAAASDVKAHATAATLPVGLIFGDMVYHIIELKDIGSVMSIAAVVFLYVTILRLNNRLEEAELRNRVYNRIRD